MFKSIINKIKSTQIERTLKEFTFGDAKKFVKAVGTYYSSACDVTAYSMDEMEKAVQANAEEIADAVAPLVTPGKQVIKDAEKLIKSVNDLAQAVSGSSLADVLSEAFDGISEKLEDNKDIEKFTESMYTINSMGESFAETIASHFNDNDHDVLNNSKDEFVESMNTLCDKVQKALDEDVISDSDNQNKDK
ncbi:MAG: hypothetical protein GY861_05810 [bacterium]|nr:hypothetical protein [bacterium]